MPPLGLCCQGWPHHLLPTSLHTWSILTFITQDVWKLVKDTVQVESTDVQYCHSICCILLIVACTMDFYILFTLFIQASVQFGRGIFLSGLMQLWAPISSCSQTFSHFAFLFCSWKIYARWRISFLIAGKEFSWHTLVTALHWMKMNSVQTVVLKRKTHQCVVQMEIPTGKKILSGFNSGIEKKNLRLTVIKLKLC